MESWRRSLDRALALQIDHLSCYGLTYESNTPMTVRKRLGQFTASTDELELQMFKQARDTLAAAGIAWYEISNYARAGQECRHNLIYWTGGNYIGLGPSAASHVDGHRFKNLPHLREWEKAVPTGQLPVVEHELLTPSQRISERILLQLRLRGGVRVDRLGLESDAYSRLQSHLRPLEVAGLIGVEGSRVFLLDAGLNVADAIAAEVAGAIDR
jgi:oxygen-independent coproporphyrinogen-3 oxidase